MHRAAADRPVPLRGKRQVPEIERNLDLREARKTLTTMCAAMRESGDSMVKTAEQSIAAPQTLA